MLANSLNKGFRGSLVTILVLYLLVFTLSIFSENTSENYFYPNIFYNYLTAQITSDSLIFIINHLLLLAGMSLVAYIVSNEEIVDKLNYFSIVIYLLINAMALSKENISLFLLSNVAILYASYKVFNIYREVNVLSNIYNACFWIATTLFLNISNIFIFPVLFVALLILRPFSLREFAVAIIGFISPIFIYECLSYLFNFNQWYIFESLSELFSNFRLPLLNIYFLPFVIAISLLFLFTVFSMMAAGFGNTVKKQKAKSIFIWQLILTVPAIFTSGITYVNVFLLYAIPLSFLIGDFFFGIKRLRLANFLLMITILSALFYLVKKTGMV